MTNPEVLTFYTAIMLFAVTFKNEVIVFAMSIINSAYKYTKDKKDSKVPKPKSFFAHLFVTSTVAFTALGAMDYFGLEISLFAFMIIFICGLSADYIMIAFDKIIKAYAESKIEKIKGKQNDG